MEYFIVKQTEPAYFGLGTLPIPGLIRSSIFPRIIRWRQNTPAIAFDW